VRRRAVRPPRRDDPAVAAPADRQVGPGRIGDCRGENR
jgi:hypothetical protein